jgi:hypothetical protein
MMSEKHSHLKQYGKDHSIKKYWPRIGTNKKAGLSPAFLLISNEYTIHLRNL